MFIKISKVINRLTWLGEILAEIALVILLLLVFHEVVVRYVMNSPTTYTVELSEYLVVFIAFMCAGWVLKQDGHVSVSFVVSNFPLKVQKQLKLVTSILAMAFCSIITWYGYKMAITAFNGSYRSSSLLEFPLWIPYSFIPLGAFILMLQYIVKIVDIFHSITGTDRQA